MMLPKKIGIQTFFVKVYSPPLLLIVLSLIFGIGLSACAGNVYWGYLLLVIYCAKHIIWISDSNVFRLKILITFLSVLAFLWGGYWYQCGVHKNRSFHTTIKHKPVHIIGIVEDKELRSNSRYPVVALIRIESIATPEKTIYDSPAYAKLFFKKPFQALPGQKITINNVFAARDRDNAHRNMLKEGLALTAFISHQNYTIENHKASIIISLRCLCTKIRNSLIDKLKNKMNPENFALFSSLFLGAPIDNSEEMTYMRKNFNHWGIAHYLARSGLHVLIMLLIWQSMMRFLPIGLGYKNILLLIILFLCSALSWSSISFTRAILSYTLARFFFLTGFQTHGLQLISLTSLLVLAYNPFHLFFLNFQLSFALAFALAWLNEIDIQSKRKMRMANPLQTHQGL